MGSPTKRWEMQLSLTGIRQVVRRLKALHFGRLIIQFQQDWPQDKQNTALFIYLAENTNLARLSFQVRL